MLIALGAVAALYLARATGLDQGLIDDVIEGAVEAVMDSPAEPEPAAAPADTSSGAGF